MPGAQELLETAFARLGEISGFTDRPSQKQLSLLLQDLMKDGMTGAFEAPTGLGKSLAILIASIASAIADGKRIVVGTYTNILAEQYWRQDLPLALSLFDSGPDVKAQILIGRQRYACLAAIETQDPDLFVDLKNRSLLGIESEFRGIGPKKDFWAFWRKVAVPNVCAGRMCPHYKGCFYYQARRTAQQAQIVITNHSVILQDALLSDSTQGEATLLNEYDFLVLDEAHDFAQSAAAGLEFELSLERIESVLGTATAMVHQLGDISIRWKPALEGPLAQFKGDLERVSRGLQNLRPTGSIVSVSPSALEAHPALLSRLDRQSWSNVQALATRAAESTRGFIRSVEELLGDAEEGGRWHELEISKNYLSIIDSFATQACGVAEEDGVTVCHFPEDRKATVRRDIVDLSRPLQRLIWERRPWACVSATLALDSEFTFFTKTTGARPDFVEILGSPFDFGNQAAVYLPPSDRIPDPTEARRAGSEDAYFDALSRELGGILSAMGGRTLALFHSRREMEVVAERIELPSGLPLLVQPKTGAAKVGWQFRRDPRASLFALRSFWTGFDAPGETLCCVVLVRIPFEVPTEPTQMTRAAWLASSGEDPFRSHSLAQAKILMRQGFGRLIRRSEDRGIVAILDARVRLKAYGEEILANFPSTVRIFDDLGTAIHSIGVEDTCDEVLVEPV